jgi:hypothetical protein
MDPTLEKAIDAHSGSPDTARLLKQIAGIESGGQFNKTSAAGAQGPFQFMPATAAQYGLTDPNDPEQAVKAAVALLNDNSVALRSNLGRDPSPGEQYLAWQQGATGASDLLNQPGLPANQIVSEKAVTMNGGTPEMTAAQFAAMWTSKIDGAAAPAPSAPVPGSLPNFTLSGGDPNDSANWDKPSELVSPDVPDQQIDPLAPSRDGVATIQPQESVNQLGGSAIHTQVLKDNAEATEFGDLTGMGFRNYNAAVGLWQYADRKGMFPRDDTFDWKGYQKEWESKVPSYYWGEYADVHSKAEADYITAQIHQELQEQQTIALAGAKGMGALGLASIFDLDIAVTLATAGGGFGVKAAKTGINMVRAAKLGRAMKNGALAGMAGGALDEAVIAATHPTGDYHNVITGALAGAGFGAGAGMVGAKEERAANLSLQNSMRDFDQRFRNGEIDIEDLGEVYSPETSDTWRVTPEGEVQTGGSAGAAANPSNAGTNPGAMPHGMTGAAGQAAQAATQWRTNSGWRQAMQTAGQNPRVRAFIDLMNKIPGVKTDWEVLRESKSAILNKLSYDLLESAEAILVNNKSAAMLKDWYFKTSSQYMPVKEQAFQLWARSRNATFMERSWKTDLRAQFDRDLLIELERRRVNDVSSAPDPHVKAAADAWQKMADETHLQRKGRAGERPVKGYENMPDTPEPGYFPRLWRGDKIREKIAKIGRKQLVKDISRLLGPAYQKLAPDERKAVAKAIISRALSKESEIDNNLIDLLAEDGRVHLERELRQRGLSAPEVKKIIQTLEGPVEERGISGRNKQRVDMDMRGRLSDGSMVMDLIENDSTFLMSHYARATAGEAALARKGIASAAEAREMINHAIAEQEALGIRPGDKGYVSREHLETIFSYFGAGPVARGLHPLARMMMQVTNLSLLNQLGLTQIAETGAQIGAVGIKRWLAVANPVIKEMFNNPGSARSKFVYKELEPLNGKIGDAHNVYRDDIMLDEMRRNPSAATDYMAKAEKMVNKLRRVQGFTSLFYQVQSAQHKITTELMIHKVMASIRDLYTMPVDQAKQVRARLASVGISGRVLDRIEKKILDGTVKFTPEGHVDLLNIHSWDYATQQDFILAMNRGTYQQVQKAMAGEEAAWMHKDLGAVFMHLKTFPFVAMKKQFARHARFMDAETMGVFWYGLGAAAVVYATKQAINGNNDKLDPGDIALGAFNMSNMTGWIPNWTDPVATMLGMNDAKMSQYGFTGVSGGIISTPPILPTINKLAHLPGAILPDGELSKSDIAVLRALPIVGGAYGISGVLNEMR